MEDASIQGFPKIKQNDLPVVYVRRAFPKPIYADEGCKLSLSPDSAH